MVNTFSDDKKIYSVDMMFAYVNIFKPKTINVKLSDLTKHLEDNCWCDPEKKVNKLTPLMVLDNPTKYKNHMKRIKEANLKYPIFMYNDWIIDGMHRITKAKLEGKKSLKAINFSKNIFKKFLINSKGEWNKAVDLKEYELIQLFYKKFCNK